MKNPVLLTLLMFCVNCSYNEKPIQIIGNWFTCGKDGFYDEIYFKDSVYMQSASNGMITNWSKYHLKNDTLIHYYSDVYKDSLKINKAIITFKNENEFTLNYITSKEFWTFNRIIEPINQLLNRDTIKKNTLIRSNLINCPDLRSKEEKEKDSLKKVNPFIYFQF
jgi:hypothetical protein